MLQGIESLSHLEVLDLRDNLLSDLYEIIKLVESHLLHLDTLGLSGNKLPKDYRSQMLAKIRRMHLQKSTLRY